jgi:hypothetical protein
MIEHKSDNIRDGIEIFAEYGKPSYAAEHDCFFCCQPYDVRISLVDQRKLYALGWFYVSEVCYGCARNPPKPLDPDNPTDEERIMQHEPDCTAWGHFV